MSIQSNFPNLKPSLLLDFANTKQLDNRVTFTRSTPAVYYDGKTTAMAEQNLLLYSVGYSWASSSSVTLSENSSTAPDGTSTAVKLIPGTNNDRHIMYQYTATGTLGSGQIITSSTYVKANGYNYAQLGYFVDGSGCSAGIIVDLTNGTIPTVNGTLVSYSSTSVGNGWYRITISFLASFSSGTGIIVAASNSGTPSTYSAGSPQFTGDGTSAIYYWGIQMEVRSSATAYTATTSQPITNYIPVLLTAGGNQPRFDCNPTTGESLGLLIEEQRTNFQTYSSNFSNAAWSKSRATIVENTVVAPDGTLTGDFLTTNGTGGTKIVYFLGVTTPTANSIYTASIYAKNNGSNSNFKIEIGSGANNGQGTFNLSTGTVGTFSISGTVTACSGTITSVGNGWYRCTITVTHGASWSGTTNTAFYDESSQTASTVTGMFLWGAQVEAGAFATSYIATTSASATRTADAASMTGTNFSSWYNAAEGSVYTEFAVNAPSVADGFGRVFQFDDGTNNNAIQLLKNNGASSVYYTNVSVGGASVATLFTPAITANTFVKVGTGYKVNDFAQYTNGGTLQTDNAGGIPVVNRLQIGAAAGGSGQPNGTIKKIAYYPLRVTNAQLQALTS